MMIFHNLLKFLIPTLLLLPGFTTAAETELRGIWVAWAGSNVPSKSRIREMMENIAAHNLNTVYVDVWRFGFPYFRSDVFFQLTGLYTDPALADGRDVLAEMVAEGHRVGLHVEAWFEYGFVTGQGNNDHLYRVHPDWFAQHKNGSVLFNGDYRYKWLSHCHPAAWQFLIDLCQEVVLKYDVDGLELDRIRYPELDCGYDSATVALYQSEHVGAYPPASGYDLARMRWRAEKLTAFTAIFHDSLKAVRPDLPISNAPIVYSYGFENFCQDWRPWINNGYLAFVSPQVYRATNLIYSRELSTQLSYVSNKTKFFPGLTSITDGGLVATNEIVAMIQTTRQKGLNGHVIWFYDTLVDDLPTLKSEVYQNFAVPPDRPEGWRQPGIVIHETDPAVTKSPGWVSYTGLPGFEGGCFYAQNSDFQWIDYHADIPVTGWYELYCYNIFQWNATPAAAYQVFHANGSDTVNIDQSRTGLAGWQKIGDYYFNAGPAQRVLRLTNEGVVDNNLFADAMMLTNTNRPQFPGTGVLPQPAGVATNSRLLQNFPNPFNPLTWIAFSLPRTEFVRLEVFDVTGRLVQVLHAGFLDAGEYQFPFEASHLPAGVYLYQIKTQLHEQQRKMLLLK